MRVAPIAWAFDNLEDVERFAKASAVVSHNNPETIIAYLEASDFESSIRNAVSLGGDADTQVAITGAIAEGSWEIPDEIKAKCLSLLDNFPLNVVRNWQIWLKA